MSQGLHFAAMLRRLTFLALTALTLASCDHSGIREIRVVGSSTVFPFTNAVAESFVNQDPSRRTPVIESTGTGAGFKRFCDGIGAQFPDIANASRRMHKSEWEQCTANKVGEVMEVQIGLDGVALAESNRGPKLQLTKKDLYLALAANPMGQPNRARTWADVNPALPPIPIQVLGPPATSGTRDVFVELILEPGCALAMSTAKALKDSDPPKYDDACKRIRDDGAYVDKGENDNLIVQGLSQNPNALGIFGFSYLEENKSRLHGVAIDGVAPSYETISQGQYPGARALFIYVKKRHLRAVPGLRDFLSLYAAMWNPEGELVRKHGLIAATDAGRAGALDVLRRELPLDTAKLH